jgi:hypothetical protein
MGRLQPGLRLQRHRVDREAASGVVTIMLTILTIILVMTLITTAWMPVWMKDREARHMRAVNADFNVIKSNIDTIVLQKDPTFLVSSPIVLGTEGFAMFETDSSGAFSINYFKGDVPEFSCNVRNQTGGLNVTSTGGFKYSSNNRYYVDSDMAYENGAIVVAQGSKQVVKVGPQFTVEKLGTVAKVGFVLIGVSGQETSIQGVGPIMIDSQLVTYTSANNTFAQPEWLNITIISEYPQAWERYYATTLIKTGFTSGTGFQTAIAGSKLTVSINNTKYFDLGYGLVGTEIETNAGREGAVKPLPGAVAIWHMSEGSGGTTADATSNLNDGTLSGAKWTTKGVAGSALTLDGDDHVDVTDSASLNPTAGLTVEAWLKWDIDPATGDQWANVVDKGRDNEYQLQFSGTAKPGPVNNAFEFAVRTDVERRFVWSTSSPVNGEWFHVVGTYDAASESIRIYVNGALEGSMLINGTTVNPDVLDLAIGARNVGAGSFDRFFHGTVDEVYVYDRALSATEVAMRYVNTRPMHGG